MGDHRLNRQPSGRGRSTKRTRTPSAAPSAPAAPNKRTEARRGPRMALTRRALAVVAVVALLVFSFAGALRVWLMQSQELALATAQIEQRQAQIAELENELARWQDSAYVRTQARARLGWVMPGDVGYRVIGPDGEVLSGTSEIEGVGAAHSTGLEERWWDHLSTSLQEADRLDRPAR